MGNRARMEPIKDENVVEELLEKKYITREEAYKILRLRESALRARRYDLGIEDIKFPHKRERMLDIEDILDAKELEQYPARREEILKRIKERTEARPDWMRDSRLTKRKVS